MLKKIATAAVLLSLLLIVVACTGSTSTPKSTPAPTPAPAPTTTTPSPSPEPTPPPALSPVPRPSGPIKAKWIDPQVDGNTISIPVSELENNWNIHFNIELQGEDMNFMAYIAGEKIHVRANVCPPCRSIGFSLENDILICDRCATTFVSETGDGIQGPCVDFPKASVPYKINDGNVVMNESDLVTAYQNTIKPGQP